MRTTSIVSRVLASALFLVGLGTATPARADLRNWDLGGHFRLRGERDEFNDYVTTREFALIRARIDVQYRALDEITVFAQPQFAKALGDTAWAGSSSSTNTLTQTSGGTFDSSALFHQAYADYHPWSAFSLILGRQVLSYGDELIIGNLDWSNIGRSFDAVRAQYRYGGGHGDVFAAKLVDANVTTSAEGDFDLYGAYNTLDLGPGLKEFDQYALYLVDGRGLGAKTLSLWTLGTRAKSQVGDGFDYRLEAAYQLGSALGVNQHGGQVDVEAGRIFWAAQNLRLALGGFYASKDYNQLFPTVHKWLGTADVFGRRNITGGQFRTSARPTDRLTLFLDVLHFFRADSDFSAFKINGTTPLGSAGGSQSKDLGTEFDLWARFEASERVAFSAGSSLLAAGAYLRDQFGDRLPVFAYMQMEVKLK